MRLGIQHTTDQRSINPKEKGEEECRISVTNQSWITSSMIIELLILTQEHLATAVEIVFFSARALQTALQH